MLFGLVCQNVFDTDCFWGNHLQLFVSCVIVCVIITVMHNYFFIGTPDGI